MATLGERIKALRQKQGLSQGELARRCGISQAAISRLETGSMKDVETAIARRLARALGTSVDYLIGTFEDEDVEALATAVA
jgi:transcriptional regulator with XRE-family HTH domain